MIAELGGAHDPGEEKRLSLTDPLVTAVMGDRFAEAAESESESSATDSAGSIADVDSAEAPVSEQESAIDTLRRRRIERLAKTTRSE